ncbi:hypothetical protein ACET3Z_013980 [Daucus carota]
MQLLLLLLLALQHFCSGLKAQKLITTVTFNVTYNITDDNHSILNAETITKPGCPKKCGNLTVPYPFGIISEGLSCSKDPSLDITCNYSTNPPKGFIKTSNLEVYDISNTELRVLNLMASRCYDSGVLIGGQNSQTGLRGTSYMFSNANVLTVVGCDDYAYLYNAPNTTLPKGCLSTCQHTEQALEDDCTGTGCCQISINLQQYFQLRLGSFSNHTNLSSSNNCGYSFLGERSRFKFQGKSDLDDPNFLNRTMANVPIVLDWVIENKTCSEASKDLDSYACIHPNSDCINNYHSGVFQGYRCTCKNGYKGNPYLSPGCEELKKATNNYASDRILGQGGYGVVYKGILSDERVVAIKKSKILDKTQVEQFINEVKILTQVKHKNVVKLLGCCLESEVPMLVYEFVPNGTLFHHVHNVDGAGSWLSLENRLRIAAESSGALAYLHSAVSIPIIHRDVKLANILLDDNHVAKIADFGASRLIPMDQTEVTTLVQGTLGYLDPEYFYTGQLTEKSDVYSFGVVFAELLTGRQPICMANPQEERNLATYFVTSLKENRLFQIIEPRLLKEGTLDQLQKAAKLVKRCLNLSGEERPTMKEVTMEIEGLRKLAKHPWANQHGDEDTTSLLGHTENQHSDLYEIQLSSYHNVVKDSKPYSSSTISLLHPPTSPR